MKGYKDFNIQIKFLLLFAAMFLVGVMNYCGVQYFADAQKDDAAVVDASGRNRMLSQRIAFFCERIVKNEKVKPELGKAIELLDASIKALKSGGVAPGIANNRVLPATPLRIMPALLTAETLWKEYKMHAEVIMNVATQEELVIPVADTLPSVQKTVDPKVAASILFVEKNATPFLLKLNDVVKLYSENADAKRRALHSFLFVLLLADLGIIFFGLYVAKKYLSKPIMLINSTTQRLATGDVSGDMDYDSDDEIGKVVSDIKIITNNIKGAAKFAQEIGGGNFENDYRLAGDADLLGRALLSMRDKLAEVNREEDKRNWATEGMAKFAEILRKDQSNLKSLCNAIVLFIVKYMNANQGGLFIINEEVQEDCFLELMGTYAWDREKFIERRIEMGQGMIGQVWLEKELVYLTKVPANYITITSGLGDANPRSIIMVPIKMENEVFGVIEIASFNEYEPHELELVRKLSDSIASTIASVKISDRTRRLLQDSQQQSEQLRSQEEEMRQNMEELSATQEEMERKEAGYIQRIKELEQSLKNLTGKVIT